MLVKCPSCNAEYDCEPGKYQCVCNAKFKVMPDGSVTPTDNDSTNRSGLMFDTDANDVTMPGRRIRKPDGRFETGYMILGRYRVLSELGRGGMGVVYKCFDETAGIEIALKALPPELSQNTQEMNDVRENFRLVSRLVHQNIAIYRNLERDSITGNCYLIMEYVSGEDLRSWIRRKREEGGPTLENVIPIIRQVAAALDYAHGEKIIHRDIKPGNIMINEEGHVKVLDFGLAAQIHTSMSRISVSSTGETSGTAPYMAPEQWRGKVQGPAADQYALAVMTYEMLAGHLPFDNPDISVLREAVLNETPDPLESLPRFVQTAIERAMSKDPAQRYDKCSVFATTLARGQMKSSFSGSRRTAVKGVATIPVAKPVDNPASDRSQQEKKSSERMKTPDRPSAREKVKTPDVPSAREKRLKPDVPSLEKKKRNRFGLIVGIIAAVVVIAGVFVLLFLKTKSDRGASPEAVSAESSDDGKTIVLPGGVEMKMVKIEAGTFEMSRKDGENYFSEVAHEATLTRNFYLAKTEVTQAQWKAVMGTEPSNFKGDDLPVEKVSWNDAMEFCEKLNDSGAAPDGWKFSLPTETQWEYAARGGNKSKGYKFSGSDKLDEVAWYYENSGDIRLTVSSWSADKLEKNHCTTHPVGRKKPNELGLYDMSGNVWEWCLDDFHDRSDSLTAEFTRGNDEGGSRRANRGGAWYDDLRHCRSSIRNPDSPDERNRYLGFRPALVPAAGYSADDETPPEEVTVTPQTQTETQPPKQTESKTQQSTETQSPEPAEDEAQPPSQIPPGDETIVLSGGVKLELVKVEAGTFEMSTKDGANDSNEVAHMATLTKDFFIGRTEVTQAQWKAVMGSNPSNFKGDDLPVEKVTWNEAMEFCGKLNSTGKAPGGWKFTLPTETQWEFAARGGNKSKGYKYSGSDDVGEVAWYYENSGDSRLNDSSWPEKLDSNHCKTHPVGRKKANELGLYDMSGNAWEWCLDDWQAMSNRSTAEFTRGNDKGGSNRTVRGGGWDSFAGDVRSTDRGIHSPDGRSYSLGFRVALVPADGYGTAMAATSGTVAQQTQKQPGDRTINLPGGVKLELVKVEAGTFEMSAKDGENNSNEVTHSATLTKDFYIGRTEVTQAQWKAMMGSNPSNFKGDDHPVEKVTWNDAMEFCEKLNTSGRAPKGWKYSLPTETQWEYAARGGKKSKGYKYSGSNDAGEVAWYWNNAEKKTHPVGQKKANELGLYDMSGNVMEWCLDDWKDESDKVTAEFTRGNDRGSSLCARRGGSWNDNANFSRSAGRNNCSPGILYDGLGFRVALVPESY